MSFICHIHNYTEYNQQWNVFSVFNPSKCTHTWSSRQPTLRRRGAVGGSVLCSRVSPQSWTLQGHNRGPPWLGVSRFMVLSRFFVMLVFLFCKLFEHYSQTNFPIINTKPFKVTIYIYIYIYIYCLFTGIVVDQLWSLSWSAFGRKHEVWGSVVCACAGMAYQLFFFLSN